MSGRVIRTNRLVESLTHNPIVGNHHCADWDFTGVEREPRLCQRLTHERLVS